MSIRIGIGRIAVYGGTGSSWTQYWLDKTPTTLALTNVGYPEGIQLDWLNAGSGYDGTSIERSADGVTYAEIGTVASGVLTYTDATAVFQTLYYYRVRAYKGTNYSPYSNIESLEVTSDRFMITVDTTKAGSADTHFVLPVTAKSASDYYVDWGDGGAEETFTTTGNKDHTYASSGTYQVKVRGGMTALAFNNAGDCAKLIYIDNWGNIAWSSMENAFYGCSNMKSTTIDTANTSLVTTFAYAFRGCSSLTTLDTSGWDTAEVQSFYGAFRDCSLLTALDVSGWDTGEVTSFADAFHGCTSLKTLDVSGWDTAKVTSFLRAFRFCFLLTTLDTSGWNTAEVTSFYLAFHDCSFLKGDFSHIILNAATDIRDMFLGDNINNTGTTTNYDALLIAWNADANTPNSLNFHAGTSKYGEGLVDSGTTDGVSAGKLIQSGQNFNTTVTVGDVIHNTTDGTYAFVTAIDSDTQLSISRDIMANAEAYAILHSDAAKARAQLVIPTASGGQGWTITDGGY